MTVKGYVTFTARAKVVTCSPKSNAFSFKRIKEEILDELWHYQIPILDGSIHLDLDDIRIIDIAKKLKEA